MIISLKYIKKDNNPVKQKLKEKVKNVQKVQLNNHHHHKSIKINLLIKKNYHNKLIKVLTPIQKDKLSIELPFSPVSTSPSFQQQK
jgi:hypothetical protein